MNPTPDSQGLGSQCQAERSEASSEILQTAQDDRNALKCVSPDSSNPTKQFGYGLVGLIAALIAVYFHFGQTSNDTTHLGMSGLFLFAVAMLLWEKRQRLIFSAPWGDRLLGVAILALIGWHHAWLNEPLVLRLFPFVAAIGVGLIASGLGGLKHYRSELLILFFLGGPSVLGALLFDTTLPTAAFSTMLLWYAGYPVVRDGVFIMLPGGGVEVYGGCSGMEMMTYLLGVSVIYLVMFPTRQGRRFCVPFMAVGLGFVINGIRVALLALLSAFGKTAAFDYWHDGRGSTLFGLLGVLLLGGCYWLLTSGRSHRPPPQPNATVENEFTVE